MTYPLHSIDHLYYHVQHLFSQTTKKRVHRFFFSIFFRPRSFAWSMVWPLRSPLPPSPPSIFQALSGTLTPPSPSLHNLHFQRMNCCCRLRDKNKKKKKKSGGGGEVKVWNLFAFRGFTTFGTSNGKYSGISGFHCGISGFHSGISGFHCGISGFHCGISGFHCGISEFHCGISEFHCVITFLVKKKLTQRLLVVRPLDLIFSLSLSLPANNHTAAINPCRIPSSLCTTKAFQGQGALWTIRKNNYTLVLLLFLYIEKPFSYGDST